MSGREREREREREVREGKEGVTETQAKNRGSHHFLNQDPPLSPLIFSRVLLVTGLPSSLSCYNLSVRLKVYFLYFSLLCWRMLWPRLHIFSPEKCASRLEFPSTLPRHLLICADIYWVIVSKGAVWVSLTQRRRHGRGARGWDALQLITTTAPADWWVDVYLILLLICIF